MAIKQNHLYAWQNRKKKKKKKRRKKNQANAKWAKYVVKPDELNKGNTIR